MFYEEKNMRIFNWNIQYTSNLSFHFFFSEPLYKFLDFNHNFFLYFFFYFRSSTEQNKRKTCNVLSSPFPHPLQTFEAVSTALASSSSHSIAGLDAVLWTGDCPEAGRSGAQRTGSLHYLILYTFCHWSLE